MAFAPLEQKATAMEIMKNGEALKKQFSEEKQKLQDKIDALPLD